MHAYRCPDLILEAFLGREHQAARPEIVSCKKVKRYSTLLDTDVHYRRIGKPGCLIIKKPKKKSCLVSCGEEHATATLNTTRKVFNVTAI